MELAGGRHETPPRLERQRRQPACHEFMRVLSERDVLRPVAEQTREPGTHACSLFKRAIPLVINELRRIEPRALLRLEGDVGPGLMGMSGKENPFGDSETGIVRRERVRHSETTPDLPQVREQWLADRRRQIRSTARSTGSRLHAYRAFHHLYVPVAPFLQAFVEIHEAFTQLRVLRVAPVDVDENPLHLR